MKTKLSLIVFLVLFFTSSLQADENSIREETYKNLEVFSNVLMLLQEHYVDTIEPHDVISGAINGMLTSLDPHSAYMVPEDFKELQEETHGSFSGIGIEITINDGMLTVVSPIEDTPAYIAGLKAGDQIIEIENEPTKNMTLMDASKDSEEKKVLALPFPFTEPDGKNLKTSLLFATKSHSTALNQQNSNRTSSISAFQTFKQTPPAILRMLFMSRRTKDPYQV